MLKYNSLKPAVPRSPDLWFWSHKTTNRSLSFPLSLLSHPTSTASPWPCCSSPQKTGSDAYLTVQKGSDKIRWLMLQKWALLSTKGAFINHDLSFSRHPWCGHLKPGEMNPSPRTQRNSSWDLGKQNCHILSHPCFLLIWACLLIAEQ